MIILPIINKGRVMFAEVTLKDAQKIHSGVVFEGMQESDVIVNQQPYSESSYLHDKEDSSVVSFIRNSSLISQNDFMVSTREGRESKYDVYQVKQPPKFVNKALDNLYASVITDMRKELPGTKKGRYISLDKLGLDDELSDEGKQYAMNALDSLDSTLEYLVPNYRERFREWITDKAADGLDTLSDLRDQGLELWEEIQTKRNTR